MSFTTPPPPPPPSGPPPPPGPPGGGGTPPPPPGGYPPGGWTPGGPGPGGYGPGGYGQGSWPSGPKPPNYLVWAILTTLFCCLPFGIVSIVFAAQVDSKFNSGDVAGAQRASENAKKWAIVAAAVSVGFFLLWILLAGLGAGLG
jgi:hypothetical protein